MNLRGPWALMMLALLSGCERGERAHPFEAIPLAVTRTIDGGGGIISNPAGAAIHFAPGTLNAPQTLALSPGQAASNLPASGRPIGSSAFLLGPLGVAFSNAARAELALDRARGDSLWLSSLIRTTPQGVYEQGNTRVDVGFGIASANIFGTGVLAAVVPNADALVALSSQLPPSPSGGPLTPAEMAQMLLVDSLSVNCGSPGNRCTGLVVAATDNLLSRVGRTALVYPRLSGVLRRQGTEVIGTIAVDASFRMELASGNTAENLPIVRVFQVRASLVESALQTSVAEQDGGQGTITIYPPRDGHPARALVERRLQIPDATGVLQPARIFISFPFEVHR
ncbi:hypothetical protein BH23GEM6_BH23GEM6_10010 [soil metagenome]